MEHKFGSWAVAEIPFTVEYSLTVMEEIRQAVAEGFQRFARGGIEVGGVLFGRHDAGSVQVLAVGMIDCEHAHGPAFVLSDKDKEGLRSLLADASGNPKYAGMSLVGWFLSHTRSEIALTESDAALFNEFFKEPWQIALVLRPGRHGAMRAGFFAREKNGTLKTDRSYLDFNLPDRVMAFERIAVRGRSPAPERRPLYERTAEPEIASTAAVPAMPPEPREIRAPRMESPRVPVPVPVPSPDAARPIISEPARAARRWIWLAVWGLVVVGAIAAGLHFYQSNTPMEPLALQALEREGQLAIEWNRQAGPITSASRGALEIIDGKESRPINLTREDLAKGKLTYSRKTGEVEIRLVVNTDDGRLAQESVRFLGRPPSTPVDSDERTALMKERDRLAGEVARLQKAHDDQAGKIQQLERTIRILESRLGIDRGKQ
jgi:hypothetical protein